MKYYTPIRAFVFIFTALFSRFADAECDTDCIDVGHWDVNIAMGLSDYSSAYAYDDDVSPLTIMADISWYGEHYYLDNTEIGRTQWLGNLELDAYIRVNPEKWLLQSAPTISVLPLPNSASIPTDNIDFGSTTENAQDASDKIIVLSEDQQAWQNIQQNGIRIQPKWSLDGGIRIRYPLQSGMLTASFNHDISNIYQGYDLTLGIQYRFQWQQWTVITNPAMSYKSEGLVNYYYGISSVSNSHSAIQGGWFPRLNITSSKPLSGQWGWLLHANYQRLPSHLQASPIIQTNHFLRLFAGITYEF